MKIKVQFCVVVTYNQQHKIRYGSIDYEEGSAVFDLSNRTDGESVSDYPLLRDWSYCRGRSLWHSSCCQVSALPSFTHLKTTTEHLEGISAQTDNMQSKIRIAFIWELKVLVEDLYNMLLSKD